MDIEKKLNQMDAKLDSIQGDVNILSTLNKETRKEEVKDLLNSKFGRSKNKRKVWLAADGEKTLEEIQEDIGIPMGSVHSAAADLNDQGLLRKRERDGMTIYWKAEISTDIGLEEDVQDYLSND